MSGEHTATPGPWTPTPIAQGTADYCIHAAGIPWQLAYLAENSQIAWPIEANARLIAAAPDLLAALREARAMLVHEGYLPLGLRDIDAVLAKAEAKP